MIRVGVMGAGGRMGREICRSVVAEEGLELVAAFDRSYQGMEIGALIGMPVEGVLVETDLDKLLDTVAIDVMIDFIVLFFKLVFHHIQRLHSLFFCFFDFRCMFFCKVVNKNFNIFSSFFA